MYIGLCAGIILICTCVYKLKGYIRFKDKNKKYKATTLDKLTNNDDLSYFTTTINGIAIKAYVDHKNDKLLQL